MDEVPGSSGTSGKYEEKSSSSKTGTKKKNWISKNFSRFFTKTPGSQNLSTEPHSLEEVAKYIVNKPCENIIVLSGAGLSTSAGIPDFRSPGSGIYDNLKKFNLQRPENIFDANFFKKNPEPFFTLMKDLMPKKPLKPTLGHYFLRFLHEKGILKRIYTQNVDGLEYDAGIPKEKVIEAHGTFRSSHCTNPSCKAVYDQKWLVEKVSKETIPKCDKCKCVVKPDIVLFGDNLPEAFFKGVQHDFPKCDCLLIIGTSLAVHPFADLVDRVSKTCPRLLINREKAGHLSFVEKLFVAGFQGGFDSSKHKRDITWLGDCDDGCTKMVEAMDCKDEFMELVNRERETGPFAETPFFD